MTPSLLALMSSFAFGADELVYGEELGPFWYDWSWSYSELDWASTSNPRQGANAIRAVLVDYGGLSVQRDDGIATTSALRFFIRGQAPSMVLRLESTVEGAVYEVPIDVTDAWTEYTIQLDPLPPLIWNRISWVDTGGVGATIWVDEVELLDQDPLVTEFRAAEPVPPDRIVLYGAGDAEAVTVRLDGEVLPVTDIDEEGGPTRTYLTLDAPLGPGVLEIETAEETFTRTIVSQSIAIGEEITHTIPDAIYGANFPDDPPTPVAMDRYGYGAIRWGGNARVLYNPDTTITNVGDDYYFLNVPVNPSLEQWASQIESPILLTVPNLDWVANGLQTSAYSVDKYGAQEEVAPVDDDAGNGIGLDGEPIVNDPTDVCVPWSSDDTRDWLAELSFTPDILAIGNETDIAHITHRAVHPEPATYEEQLDRFLDHADAAKDVLPSVPVAGPVGCCWYFYWNSGDPDDAAVYGDFLPWFLTEVAKADALAGRRRLDILDLHYYPENLISKDWKNQSSEAIDAWRLRATRSLWDPEWIDESYVGDPEIAPVTDQPQPDRVQLIPRLRALIDEHYPGTKLALSEWGFGDVEGISGGLAAAKALGIFGRERLDYAFMWPGPPVGSPAAAAFELYRGEHAFGRSSLPVTGGDPNALAAYASRIGLDGVALVLVNTSPDVDLRVELAGVDEGRLEVEHFGESVGARVVEHPAGSFEGFVTIPAYSAALVTISTEKDPPPPPPVEDTGTAPPPVVIADPPGSGRCGSCQSSGPAGLAWVALLGVVALARRRSHRARAPAVTAVCGRRSARGPVER